MQAYGIGEVSRRTGINIETIRYYERIKLLPAPGRSAGGNRQYDQEGLKRLSFVKRCRTLGFSIEEIRTLLEMVDRKDFTCGEVHGITIAHLATVKQKITQLMRLQDALTQMAAECDQGGVPACPIIDILFEAAEPPAQ